MFRCSWRRSRVSLSFLVALVDDLRLDEAADLPTSSSRVAVPDGLRPPLPSLPAARDRRARCDLADVDLLALPRRASACVTTVKLFVDATRPGARYETVPPPPLSWDPGVSLIAGAGAAVAPKVKFVSLLLDWLFRDIFINPPPFSASRWLVEGQEDRDVVEVEVRVGPPYAQRERTADNLRMDNALLYVV